MVYVVDEYLEKNCHDLTYVCSKSTRDVVSDSANMTEELIDKHEKCLDHVSKEH